MREKTQTSKQAKKLNMKDYLQPQLWIGGVETPHADGRVEALVIFNSIPKLLLLLKDSHKHMGVSFKTLLKPEQQEPSGFEMLLPFMTKVRQSAMLRSTVEQSTEGDGA